MQFIQDVWFFLPFFYPTSDILMFLFVKIISWNIERGDPANNTHSEITTFWNNHICWRTRSSCLHTSLQASEQSAIVIGSLTSVSSMPPNENVFGMRSNRSTHGRTPPVLVGIVVIVEPVCIEWCLNMFVLTTILKPEFEWCFE